MIMRLLRICITLTALLQWIEGQENVQEEGFPASGNQSIIFSKREQNANDSGEARSDFSTTNKPEEETDIQEFPPIRCLGCDHYCSSFEDGKDEVGKGNRMCHLQLGVLHGCVSIFMYGLKRKCITDMTMEEKSYCKENAKLCVECSKPDCNYVNLTINGLQTSGSVSFKTSLILLLSSLLIRRLVIDELCLIHWTGYE